MKTKLIVILMAVWLPRLAQTVDAQRVDTTFWSNDATMTREQMRSIDSIAHVLEGMAKGCVVQDTVKSMVLDSVVTEVVDQKGQVVDKQVLTTPKALTAWEKKIIAKAVTEVRFERSKVQIKAESYEYLNQLAAIMKKHRDVVVRIVGYTDNMGNPQINQELSDKRAHAVRAYLLGKGVGNTQLIAQGLGSVNPIADNSTRAGREANNRVEMRIEK